MSADKVQELQDKCVEVVAQATAAMLRGGAIPSMTDAFDALIAAVRADEKARCIAAVASLPVYVVPTHSAQFEIEEAIRNA